jgi:hypothetical protein
VQVLTIALAVTVIGNAGLVSWQVVGETALARIVPREALGRVIGIFNAVSAATIIAGAVLAPVLMASLSLRASLLVLGVVALTVTVLCGLGLRGLDALNAQRADALASRVMILRDLPVTVGVPQIVLEQLAAAAQFCPLPPGGRRCRRGGSGSCLLRCRRRPCRGAPGTARLGASGSWRQLR